MNGVTSYAAEREPSSSDRGVTPYPDLPLFERHRAVLGLVEGDTILDVGCYTGTFVREAVLCFPHKTVLGIDYSAEHIRAAQLLYPAMREHFRAMSVYKLALGDASVDCITLQETLEHLEGAALAVKELNRVLKLGGVLIVSVPNPYYVGRAARFVQIEIRNAWQRWRGRPQNLQPEMLSLEDEWDRHVHGWTPQTLLALLAHNGFQYVVHCYENGMRDAFRRSVLRLLPFLGPTLILKVRKIGPAPARLV